MTINKSHIPPDYFPFGMRMSSRSSNSADYTYGFQGQEMDDELKGSGNSLDYGNRMYDPRLGRWLAVDPVFKAMISPYAGMSNNPILIIDMFGLDDFIYNGKRLYYRDDDGVVKWSVSAVSGVGKYMNDSKYTKIKDKGPIPAGSYYINLMKGVPNQKPRDNPNTGWGRYAVRLEPTMLTRLNLKLFYGRGSFFLHEDGNSETNPGTGGCIGCTKDDNGILKVQSTLIAYEEDGNDEIGVEVDYGYSSNLNYTVNTEEDNLNLRSSPGGSVIGSLEKGSSLTGTGNVDGDWSEIETSDGNTGWVSSQYLK